MSADTAPSTAAPRTNAVIRDILRGSVVTTILAFVIAFVVGGVLIAVTSAEVREAAGYFFARPGDTFAAIWDAVAGGYEALFRGAIYNTRADDFATGIRSLTNSIGYSAPLIAAGLGVALAFRVGMFNIGAQGQIIFGAAFAALITFPMGLSAPLQIVMTMLGAVVGGAVWAGIVGVLKALTGAHEVILTIMLNYVAVYLVTWMVSTAGVLQREGSNQPISEATPEAAIFPKLLGPQYPALDWGFVFVLLAAVFVYWLIERSSLGMRMRAVGENPHAARAAGVNVERIYVYAMLFAGGLAGLAAAQQIQGAVTSGFTSSIDAGFGFDAITVALLGRSRAFGTVAAGLLFGALKAGSYSMQASEGIPVDIVLVVQAVVVLFVAAPPLVRTIFFLPQTEQEKQAKQRARQARKAVAQ
ncbi:ABC transporter permease subunit [Microbacterium excoecariae]|uniref:ABC transporter permease subunit n=1 Tax=Microbacterium excoecariae TaxID=2715210 RepID=UPI00140CEEF4|nr:ABC transporter permease [Microbacterium excoecariae]